MTHLEGECSYGHAEAAAAATEEEEEEEDISRSVTCLFVFLFASPNRRAWSVEHLSELPVLMVSDGSVCVSCRSISFMRLTCGPRWWHKCLFSSTPL